MRRFAIKASGARVKGVLHAGMRRAAVCNFKGVSLNSCATVAAALMEQHACGVQVMKK
jgi:hypothetical protein